jgi:hypothetical protein
MGAVGLHPATEGSPVLEWGVAAAPHPGEAVSGDLHVVQPWRDGVLVAVADGLGHGEEAAVAARRAVAAAARHADESVIGIVRRCHEALVGTRGVAMSVASFNGADQTMSWLGIGNVQGVLVRADPHADPREEPILMRSGVVGLQLPLLRASVTAVARGDLLVVATDGLDPACLARLSRGGPPQAFAERLLARFNRGTDDALVLVARYRGPSRDPS